jgi:porphobilinogen synthase
MLPEFPVSRPRRLRRTEALRALVRETTVHPEDLVLPLFAVPGQGVRNPVGSMPGVFQTSVDELVRDAEAALALGVRSVLLFGIPEEKDAEGSGAWIEGGIVQRAIRALKRELPDLVVVTDVCLCEYTSHGHCGILRGDTVANDPTLELLARTAVSHAAAGADLVAPSDMMDGRVAAIRRGLDGGDFPEVGIVSYAVKYASAFYGPFREAAESTPETGDRRGYQMDPANAREALREAALDVAEGADVLMVKPASVYLDVLWRVKEQTGLPVWAYHVSGEFSMIMAAAERGWIDAARAMDEVVTAIRRAGADRIVTYAAKDLARRRRESAMV